MFQKAEDPERPDQADLTDLAVHGGSAGDFGRSSLEDGSGA
jgi:hypothetical protein